MAGWLKAANVDFISLQAAVFCGECELISVNNTPFCLACGSKALLSLSRVMGGSLHGVSTANLIHDAAFDRIVRELLHTVPAPAAEVFAALADPPHAPRHRSHTKSQERSLRRHTSRVLGNVSAFDLDLEPAISVITDRAQVLTGATGAAIALRKGEEIVCRSRAGRTAPDLGVRLQTETGISAHCVRTGEILVCNDAEANPQVDVAASRRLGVRSILVAPLRCFQHTLGVFEVLSSNPYAFDQRHVATLQMLSGMMVAAISRVLERHQPAR